MKNRSELREIIMKVLYQVYILEKANLDINIDDLIGSKLSILNMIEIVSDKGIILED